MLSIRISELKKFTSMLFTEDAFDRFCLHDAVFRTAASTVIDGSRNAEFYDEGEAPDEPYVLWSEIRPLAYQAIRGSRLPVSFRLVFLTSSQATQAMVRRSGFSDCEVTSLSLNLSYRDKVLTLTTGVSYNGFSMEKSLEKYWDASVLQFLDKNGLTYTEA